MALRTYLKYLWLFALIKTTYTIKDRAQIDLNNQILKYTNSVIKHILTHDNKTNLIFSPFAIQHEMVLVMQAAKGSTYTKIKNSLNLDGVSDRKIIETFATVNSTHEFICLDEIFYTKELELETPFRIILNNLFNVTTKALESENSAQNVEQINYAAMLASEGIINDYLNIDDMKQTKSVYFFNLAYFKRHWVLPFNKRNTRLRPFFNWGNKKQFIKSLYSIQEVGYAAYEQLQARAIELYYHDSNEKLVILLPDERDGLFELQQKLVNQDFRPLLKKLTVKTVAISMPHFHIEYRTDAVELMQQLSSEPIFTSDADFSNGFQATSDSNIPRILHKASFGVSEYGSLIDSQGSYDDLQKNDEQESPEIFFLAQHPFIFILHTDAEIHFAGRVVSFSKSNETLELQTVHVSESSNFHSKEHSTSDKNPTPLTSTEKLNKQSPSIAECIEYNPLHANIDSDEKTSSSAEFSSNPSPLIAKPIEFQKHKISEKISSPARLSACKSPSNQTPLIAKPENPILNSIELSSNEIPLNESTENNSSESESNSKNSFSNSAESTELELLPLETITNPAVQENQYKASSETSDNPNLNTVEFTKHSELSSSSGVKSCALLQKLTNDSYNQRSFCSKINLSSIQPSITENTNTKTSTPNNDQPIDYVSNKKASNQFELTERPNHSDLSSFKLTFKPFGNRISGNPISSPIELSNNEFNILENPTDIKFLHFKESSPNKENTIKKFRVTEPDTTISTEPSLEPTSITKRNQNMQNSDIVNKNSRELSKSSPSSIYEMLFASKKQSECKNFNCLFGLKN